MALDKQAIVNNVVPRLLAQGPSFSSEEGTCLYRSPQKDGTVCMCAIGMLIDDKHYSKELEGEPAHYSLVINALAASGYEIDPPEAPFDNCPDEDFLDALQRCHDDAALTGIVGGNYFATEFKANVRRLCDQYGLVVPAVVQ